MRLSESFKRTVHAGWRFRLERDADAEAEHDQELPSITEVRGVLIASRPGQRGDERMEVGTIAAQLIRKSANDLHAEQFTIDMDAHSQELADLCWEMHIFLLGNANMNMQPRTKLRAELEEENIGGSSILYIEEVHVSEGWRGGGLGLIAVREIVDQTLSESKQVGSAVVMEVSEPRLVEHFGRIGFEPLGNSDLLLLDLNRVQAVVDNDQGRMVDKCVLPHVPFDRAPPLTDDEDDSDF